MKSRLTFLLGGLALAAMPLALAQPGGLRLPKTLEAGSALSIQSSGRGPAVLYIVGHGQVLKRKVQLGETTLFSPGDLHSAGRYLAVLVGGPSTEKSEFDVTAAHHPGALSFLAKPSRLPVDLHDGISGVVYVFDAFQNLILATTPVSFQLRRCRCHANADSAHAQRSCLDKDEFRRQRRHCPVCSPSRRCNEHAGDTTSSGKSMPLNNERSAVRREA